MSERHQFIDMFIMPVVIMYNKDVNSCHGAGNRVISVLMCREQGSLLSLPVPKFIKLPREDGKLFETHPGPTFNSCRLS